MRKWFDVKSGIIGALLGALVVLLIGAAGGVMTGIPTIGRFQITCTNANCYMVDSATGQAWNNSDGQFTHPKLQDPATAAAAMAERYFGLWVYTDPNGRAGSLKIDPQGFVSATKGDEELEGRWHIEGNRLLFNIGSTPYNAELQSGGRLVMRQIGQEDKALTFKKTP
jgi:hypothetical protein